MKPASINPKAIQAATRAPAIPSPLQARLNDPANVNVEAAEAHSQDPLSLSENSTDHDLASTPRDQIGNGNDNGNGNGNGGNGAHPRFKIVILGLSITSSWGNGHATTYRGLCRGLSARGHDVLFLERDAEWCATNRDLPKPPYARTVLYKDLRQLKDRHASDIRNADFVMVGSYVPQGAQIGEWVTTHAHGATAFYDIDTPVTVARLGKGDLDYLTPSLIPRYDMYLSFTGGPMLDLLHKRFRSPMARPLYCSVDTSLYYPEECQVKYDLGYMGTYSDDRQPALDELLLEPARHWEGGKFVVAGPQYPRTIKWPKNVKRFTHLSPAKHRAFYCSQKFTLNITRADMIEAGYSPSVRLFEAAACGTPIISDFWPGLNEFFEINREIIVADSSEEALYYLLSTTDRDRQVISKRARKRVLASHTAKHRAIELESYACDVLRPTVAVE